MITEFTYGPAARPTTVQLVKGDEYTVTVTGKTGNTTFTGRYRGEASTGLRFVVDGKVVTRSRAKITEIEPVATADDEPSDAELAAVVAEDDDAPADVRDEDVAAELETVAEFTGVTSHSQGNECTRGRVHPGVCPAPAVEAPAPQGEAEMRLALAAAAAVAQAPAPAPAPADVTVTDVYDADPAVDGKRLSEMRFAEVMKLAQKYRTPGRGVARIAALRDGVAKAIHAEAARLISAGS